MGLRRRANESCGTQTLDLLPGAEASTTLPTPDPGETTGSSKHGTPVGEDQILYQVCDTQNLCDTAELIVTVNASDGSGSGGELPPCSLVVVDSFIQAPWTFTFQVRNTTSESLDFEFVIPDANYELSNLVFNGSSQSVSLSQTANGDGTFDIVVSGVLPPFQSVGGQQPNGFQGALNPTSGPPQTNCAPYWAATRPVVMLAQGSRQLWAAAGGVGQCALIAK